MMLAGAALGLGALPPDVAALDNRRRRGVVLRSWHSIAGG